MRFAAHGWLFLLAMLPLLWLLWRVSDGRARRALHALLGPRAAEHVEGERPRLRARRRILLLVAGGALVLALARPQWGAREVTIRERGTDVVIALDISNSMLAEDVAPSRLLQARAGLDSFLARLGRGRVGLVLFAGASFVQCPLTLDYEAFTESLHAVNVGIIPKGGTALTEAIHAGLEAFEGRQGRHEALILITDGEDHEGRIEDAAKEAADAGVKIYTVGIGTAEGDLIPLTIDGQQNFLKDKRGQVVKSRLDEETLQKIATTTGGAFVHATSGDFGLDTVYDDFISKMEKRELTSTMERRYEERFQIPLLLALLLVALEPLIGDRRRAQARGQKRLLGWWRRAA